MFTIVKLDKGGEVKIPDREIEKLMKQLDIPRNQAIYTWLCDEEYITDEEAEALTAKAKANKTDKVIARNVSKTATAKKPRERKVDVFKEDLIRITADNLQQFGADNVTITNPNNLIEFTYRGDKYKFHLTKTRPSKGGKK